ncbi:hypothetical protein F5J12DRAFT_833301 [Pisolithus orientalis]|uniref:uncharacterized protein n=1 Tax=Pisolithus orientalis TaxID=936130 RepID=UPI0022251F43|nr:uncharacterized protein F5J12DRAFT_833301 [Pisolithus orientalis]KAI6006252.1 hypothetical protein F5J12DRAFT_833301 [Pisolithus orientalis]
MLLNSYPMCVRWLALCFGPGCRSISCLPQGRNTLDGLNWRNLAAPRTMPPMDLVECLEFVASPLKAKHLFHWRCKKSIYHLLPSWPGDAGALHWCHWSLFFILLVVSSSNNAGALGPDLLAGATCTIAAGAPVETVVAWMSPQMSSRYPCQLLPPVLANLGND